MVATSQMLTENLKDWLLVAFLELYTVFYLNYFINFNKLINIALVLHSLLAVLTKSTNFSLAIAEENEQNTEF